MKSAWIAVATAVVLSACGRQDSPPQAAASGSPPGPNAAPAADAEGHDDAERVVEIDRGMLGDLRLTTTNVEARPGGEGAPVLGELRVNEDAYAEIGTPVAARAIRILAGPGQRVRAGQVLAELQSPDVERSRGDERQAQARVDLARRALERKRGLASERIAPLREVQEAEAELQGAEAALQAARGTLGTLGAEAGGETGRVRLRTPVAGTVVDRHLVLGEMAQPAEALFKVGDLSLLWLVAHAPERDAVRVRAGSRARVAVPALPGVALEGRVTLVGAQVDVSSRTIPVRVEVDNPSGVLRPGMSATAWLPVGEGAPVLAVPAAALQRIEDRWCVFVPRTDAAFAIRPVGRGRDLGGEVEIVNGLAAGETVVVDGAFLLKAEAEKARGAGEHHH